MNKLGEGLARAGIKISGGGDFGSVKAVIDGAARSEGPGTADVAVLPSRPPVEAIPGRLTPVPFNEDPHILRLVYLLLGAEAMVAVNPGHGTMTEVKLTLDNMLALIRDTNNPTQPIPSLFLVGEEWDREYIPGYTFRKYIELITDEMFAGNPILKQYVIFCSPGEVVRKLQEWQDPRLMKS